MQPVPTAPTAAEDGGLSTHVLHMTRLHAKRPLLVELRVINGPFEGGCRLQSGGGAWLACNTSAHLAQLEAPNCAVPLEEAPAQEQVLVRLLADPLARVTVRSSCA